MLCVRWQRQLKLAHILRTYGEESVMTIQRIHILGAAGSGKTTLARLAAARLNCPWYELDLVAYEGGYGNGRKRMLNERRAELKTILARPSWITEGFFIWWIDDLLEAADVIVWLDLPWHMSMFRLVMRHIRLSEAGENRYPGLWRFTKFFASWWPYYLERQIRIPNALDDDYGVNRATVANYLAPYMEKVIQYRRPEDVDRFLAQISKE